MSSLIDFKLLCEQLIIEQTLKSDLYQIVTDVTTAKNNYYREKKKDSNAALQSFNTSRIELRTKLKKLVWGLPLNQDGTSIQSQTDLDNFIFKREQQYPGIVLLHTSLLPRV